MKKIPSFTIDHNRLEKGVYVSRRDVTPSGDVITTFDVRMTRPNRDEALSPKALHAMEHLAATYLRNHPEWKDKVVYWGPMGCCTGCYLILQGDLIPSDILPLMIDTFRFISEFEGDIPGATPMDCGNYLFNDLSGAKQAASSFLKEILLSPQPENLSYPV